MKMESITYPCYMDFFFFILLAIIGVILMLFVLYEVFKIRWMRPNYQAIMVNYLLKILRDRGNITEKDIFETDTKILLESLEWDRKNKTYFPEPDIQYLIKAALIGILVILVYSAIMIGIMGNQVNNILDWFCSH